MRHVLVMGALLAMLEREMIEGTPSIVEPRGLMNDTDVAPRPHYYAKPLRRQGKGERKRNRKDRWR